jgi:hypothetical protein
MTHQVFEGAQAHHRSLPAPSALGVIPTTYLPIHQLPSGMVLQHVASERMVQESSILPVSACASNGNSKSNAQTSSTEMDTSVLGAE